MFEHLLAKRMSRLGTETAFEVFAKAKRLEAEGRDIVHLEIGEPDFDTPTNIRQAAARAIESGYTHYTPAAGLIQAREAIASYITRHKNVPTAADNVVIVPGGKPIMFYVILALIEEGDEVLYPNPSFPIYESCINFAGGTPVPMPLLEKNHFRLDIDDMASKITERTKLIIINSPANPTGGVLTPDDIRRIADLVRGKNIIVMSDEIYDRIIYEGEPLSIASLPDMKDQTVILDGFSKTYAMTGWRLGYGVMHPSLAERITKMMVNSNSCTAAFTQMAGIEALNGPQDEVDRMVAEFKARRDLIVAGLNSIPGVSCLLPKGAFYAFPNVSSFGKPAKEIAEYLLVNAGVAVLGGTAFGSYGEGYLRLSYATSRDNLQKAVEKMDKALRALR
ncbi:MAG: aspartate/tyrosine/aromatic aminotransferase [Bacillota bacterium]|nr:MAG: aspartate/tyrosine/aromatic aminotransferase [Bacillota bacterium]